MIYIEGVELPIEAIEYSWRTLRDVAHLYPQFVRDGGKATFHGYLISVIKRCQEQNPEMKMKHYTEYFSEFIKEITTKKFQELVDTYAPLRPKKKKGGQE